MAKQTHKQRTGKTRFGMFLQKIGGSLPDVADVGLELISGDFKGAVIAVGEALRGKDSNDPKVAEALREYEELKQKHAVEIFGLEVEDRESARDMYKDDSRIQKVFSMTFLVAYVLITCVMLYGVYELSYNNMNLDNYLVSVVTAIFTAMSTKLNTIIDFFFGGSIKKG